MRGLAELIGIIAQLYSFLIIGRVLMTWVNISPYHPVAQFLFRVTEPVLAPIRSVLPQTGGLDLSPIVASFLIYALGQILIVALTN